MRKGIICFWSFSLHTILVPRGRTPFGQHQEITTSGLVQHRKSTIHGLPVTLRMLRVKSDKSDLFWFQSIVFTKPFKNRMSLDQARGRDFLVLTKRSAASGDENACRRLLKLFLFLFQWDYRQLRHLG